MIDPFEGGAGAPRPPPTYAGARWVRGNADVNFNAFPERRPALAFDGDERTAWIPSGFLRHGRAARSSTSASPRPATSARSSCSPTATHAAGPSRCGSRDATYPLRSGWNRLPVNLRDVGSLRIEISRTRGARARGRPGRRARAADPGLPAPRAPADPHPLGARAPRRAAGLGRAQRRGRAHHRATCPGGWAPPGRALQARDPRDSADFEERIERVVELPAARRFQADAWVSPGRRPRRTPCSTAWPASAGRAASPRRARYDGVPGRRASRAFDGSAGQRVDRRLAARPARLAGLERAASATRLSSLRLVPPRRARAGALTCPPRPRRAAHPGP